MDFYNRNEELAQLSKILKRRGSDLVVVYGRRRIGKTTLLTHWMKNVSKVKSIYWVAHRTSSDILLRGFSDAVRRSIAAEQAEYVYSSWEEGLRALFSLDQKQRFVVTLDEFPYLVESEPSIPSLLQKVWDRHEKTSNLVLVLCGSHYHMMQEQLLSPRQPLYGRSTAVLVVDEISPDALAQFLPAYSPEQLVETYSVIGGVPKYLEDWNDRIPVMRNIRELILSSATLFRHEALFLIQDEIAEPRTYLAVLEALGAGSKTPAELARLTGIAINHMGKYLHTLMSLRLVRRILSSDIAHRKSTRLSRYEIRDPFLRFYFHFIYRRPDLVEQGRMDQLLKIIEKGFDAHVGRTGYEELARRHLAALGDSDALSFQPEYVGRAWDRDVEIDIVAVDWASANVLLGECKWQRKKVGPEIYEKLEKRAEKFRRLKGLKKHYVLYSKSGFTGPMLRLAEKERILLYAGGVLQPAAWGTDSNGAKSNVRSDGVPGRAPPSKTDQKVEPEIPPRGQPISF